MLTRVVIFNYPELFLYKTCYGHISRAGLHIKSWDARPIFHIKITVGAVFCKNFVLKGLADIGVDFQNVSSTNKFLP